MILVAHAGSSLLWRGRHTKILRRLAVSPEPVGADGPAIDTLPTPSKNAWFPARSSTPSGFTVSFHKCRCHLVRSGGYRDPHLEAVVQIAASSGCSRALAAHCEQA